MEKKENVEIQKSIKISVRNLIEFILVSGDIDNRRVTSVKDTDAMQQGSKIHRKIQKSMGENYHPEVSLQITIPIVYHENRFEICVEGRADGILKEKENVIVDEIKGVYLDLNYLEEAIPIHRAQVLCYAYIYGSQHNLESIDIRLTYCNMETEGIKYFEETLTLAFLETWFLELIHEYAKWANLEYMWSQKREQSIKKIVFPFEYRPSQKELVEGVYKTILRKKRLYIQAPTGVGKTISTVFPAVKAMGEGHLKKIFYLTAKTITRTVAEETFQLLREQGLKLKVITITAKEKICILEKPDCNPIACNRAKGHYDRVNDAVYDLLTNEDEINRELLLQYAKKHMVCPFEMSLDISNWTDGIICDYNYVFDPNVYLRRFFFEDKKQDYAFLIDEAHNLVERAREMYSAVLIKEDFLEAKKIAKGRSKKLENKLQICNANLLMLKRECDEFCVVEHIGDFVLHLMRLVAEYEIFLQEFQNFDGKEEMALLYLNIRHFLSIYERINEKYKIYTTYTEKGEFQIKLQCMDPSDNLSLCLERGRSAIFFSATLLPIRYYKEQLAGEEEDYAIYAPSPFDSRKRLLLIGRDVSTAYKRRTQTEYQKIIEYIFLFIQARKGNYMVFFPSYQMMNSILQEIEENQREKLDTMKLMVQKNSMTEQEREEFLNCFLEEEEQTRVGFCVMGGVFSEGIDLKEDRLIGAIIVGTGLPMVCKERELFREYFQEKREQGFEYAYLYQGMNKVLQSAGRVIRTSEDKGAILLLDERFQSMQYQNLFPREWFPNRFVNRRNLKQVLEEFWNPNRIN